MKHILVIPSIDIRNSKTIRVVQGIPELNCKEYGNDPVEMAMIWRAENAKMIHVVDFDGSLDHSDNNHKIIRDICESVIIPVIVSGGVRSYDDAAKLLDLGASRLALATMALEKPADMKKVMDEFGASKVAVCLEVIDNEIVVRGRQIKSGISPIHHALRMRELGVERFIVTDLSRNGMLQGPNLELALRIADGTGAKVTISGGVRNKDELMDVQHHAERGIDSVIIGRALYENRFPCQKLWRVAESGIFS